MKKILLLLIPIMSFGQPFKVEPIELTIFNDTSIGNDVVVYSDTIFQVRGDTMEVIKMLWHKMVDYMHDAELHQSNYAELAKEYKQHLRNDKKRYELILKQLKK